MMSVIVLISSSMCINILHDTVYGVYFITYVHVMEIARGYHSLNCVFFSYCPSFSNYNLPASLDSDDFH